MNSTRTVTIIGGGLAGLTLGIALRHRGVPVVLFEADRYPRHRVCGEFISGRGRQTLTTLGLDPVLFESGAREAMTTRFFTRAIKGPIRPLPEAALCISRFVLDAVLAREFRRLGGELREGERRVYHADSEGVVFATGRRPCPKAGRWRWFGIKAHARDIPLESDLEMHLVANGYVGICRLSDDRVNVCGLFRRDDEAGAASSRTAMLKGEPGSLLYQRLASAEFLTETIRTVAGLDLRPSLGGDHSECRIGDALTMIPPFTGNGMSMAFESAELACDPLAQWSCGTTDWKEARAQIANQCGYAFHRRLQWAGRIHALMFLGGLQPALMTWLPRFAAPWDFLYSRVR